MTDFIADDAASIAKRLKEIATRPNLDTAVGDELNWFAAKHGIERNTGETDFSLRYRIKTKITAGE